MSTDRWDSVLRVAEAAGVIEFQDFPFYSMMSSEPQFHAGIAEFNCRRFFEAHEVWEDLWHGYRESDRIFLQGLIQIAAGCFHLQSDNLNGAFSLMGKGLAKLEPYGKAHAGLDVETLVSRCGTLLDAIAVRRRGGDSVIDDHSLPTIAKLTKDHPS